jgi:N-acylglucosamine-6-phosphate 2-epimerase
LEAVADIVDAGADIIALDGTFRARPDHHSLQDLIDFCHDHKKFVLADIATEEDAEFALTNGADLLATTLSGYTEETKGQELPNFNLLKSLASKYSVPIFLEGGISKSEHVKMAFELGAYGIIIGKIITMPHFITRLFVKAAQNITKHRG